MFAGRDGKGKPMQISRTFYGGKKEAENVANELARTPARGAGRRTVKELVSLTEAAEMRARLEVIRLEVIRLDHPLPDAPPVHRDWGLGL